MENPKTTLAGYAGFTGVTLLGLGQLFPGKWGNLLTGIGAVLAGGAASVGNVAAKDGSH